MNQRLPWMLLGIFGLTFAVIWLLPVRNDSYAFLQEFKPTEEQSAGKRTLTFKSNAADLISALRKYVIDDEEATYMILRFDNGQTATYLPDECQLVIDKDSRPWLEQQWSAFKGKFGLR